MDPKASNGGRIPFTDVSNTAHGDSKERKRERDRARYDAMTVDQKNEKNKKHREARQRKKFVDEQAALDKENANPDNNVEWLHRNDSYQLHHKGDKDIFMPFGDSTPVAANGNSAIDFTNSDSAPVLGAIDDYHPDWSAEQAISTLGPIRGETNDDDDTPASTVGKRERDRARYASMTVDQKNKKNKKRREARQRKKFVDEHAALDKENVNPNNNVERLHRNDSYRLHHKGDKDIFMPFPVNLMLQVSC